MSAWLDVRDFGAVGDGKTLCTQAVQGAIDKCASQGGGTVQFPPGTYLSGTVRLKSHVRIHLGPGAVWLGSPNQADYPVIKANTTSRTNNYNHRSIVYAEGLENIAITGQGTIDGNGSHFKDKRHDGSRPLILRFIDCKDVLVEGITLQASGFWCQHYLTCERVRVHGVRVWNHETYNVDGIDIDACRDVVASDCFFDSDDDAVCLKSTLDRPCENVLITNCVISSHCNAVKLGTDSTGGFINIAVSNCSIVAPRGSKTLYGLDRGISGISLEIVDGGTMDRVVVSNVSIDGVEVPIFVRIGDRGAGMFPSEEEARAAHRVGTIRNVSFSNVVATNAGKTGCSITGIPGHDVEAITLAQVAIESEGGGEEAWAHATVPEPHAKYPEATMFGKLPAHGLFCRHVRGLVLTDVRIGTVKPDPRAALVMDDVEKARVVGLTCDGGDPLVRLDRCRDVLFQGCAPETHGAFLGLRGSATRNVCLVGNDLTKSRQTANMTDGAPPTEVKQAGNITTSR